MRHDALLLKLYVSSSGLRAASGGWGWRCVAIVETAAAGIRRETEFA